MKKISASELERVVAAAQNRRVLDFRNRIRFHSPEVLANERKLGEQIRAFLTKSGIEVEKIDKMLADNQSERRRLLEKEKADAYKLLPRIEDTFRHGIDGRFKALELANLPNINPPNFIVLDTPNYIHAHPPNILTASHIEPRNSTARMRYHQSEEGDGFFVWVSFYFHWNNSSPNPMLLANVASRLVVKGLWEVSANSSFLNPPSYVRLTADAELRVYELWESAPPSPLTQITHILDLDVEGGLPPIIGKGHSKYEWVFNGYDLVEQSSFVVPPKGVVLFEMGLFSVAGIWGPGSVDIVIDGGDSSVLCPLLQIEVREVVSRGG
jgi:hypothetical protein